MAFRPWARRMQVEVDQLPETLAALREASVDIKSVAEDLRVVAARLRQVTDTLDAAGLEESMTVLQHSAEAMRAATKGLDAWTEAVAKLPGGDLLSAFRRPGGTGRRG